MSNILKKKRVEKKRDVKPTVHVSVYDTVSKISYITKTPMKDVAEVFCRNGLYSIKVIEKFQFEFRRPYWFRYADYQTYFHGNENKIGQRAVKKAGERRRITIRFDQEIHDKLAELAYSLDVTVSSATAMLLHESIIETDILNQYLQTYIDVNLDPIRKKQLKEVIKYVSKHQDSDNEVTMRSILAFLLDEAWEYGRNFKKVLNNWIDKNSEHVDD